MMEETDFQKEAANLAEFGAYLDAAGMRSVATCPTVYAPFSSSRWGPAGDRQGSAALGLQQLQVGSSGDWQGGASLE